MLKLSLSAKPVRLDLPFDVWVEAPPLSVAAMRAAEYRAARASGEAREALGLEDGTDPTEEETAAIEGTYAEVFHRALAARITAWSGLLGEDGEPLPLTSEAKDAFASHPDLGPAFGRAYRASAGEVVTEGNVSSNSGSGGTPEVANTAAVAEPAAEPAPAS